MHNAVVYGTAMVTLGDVKRSAATLFAQGQHLAALRLYDAIVAAAPLDYDARIRVADCALALGDPRARERVSRDRAGTASRPAIRSPRSSARACSRRTAPTRSDLDRVAGRHVRQRVASCSARSRRGSRCPPDAIPIDGARRAARRRRPMRSPRRSRARSTRPTAFKELSRVAASDPAAVDAVGGRVSPRARHARAAPAAGRRAGRSARASPATRSSSSRAASCACSRPTASAARPSSRSSARTRCSARWRCCRRSRARRASACLTEVDLLEVGRQSLATLADELGPVAEALHGFTRERLLGNLMATSAAVQAVQPDAAARSAAPVHEPRRRAGHGRDQRRRGRPRPVRRAVRRARRLAAQRRTARPCRSAGCKTGDVFGEMSLLRNARTDRDRGRAAAGDRAVPRARVRRAHRRGGARNQELSRSVGRGSRDRQPARCSARTTLRPTSAS